MKITASNLIIAYEKDIAIATATMEKFPASFYQGTYSNARARYQRDILMVQLLQTVPSSFVLEGEGTPSDPCKMNAGTLAEIVLRYHFAHNPELKTLAKSGGDADAMRSGHDVEIKLCVNSKYANTKVNKAMTTYLVTLTGVYRIKKDDVLGLSALHSKGALPWAKGRPGFEKLTRIASLSALLGFTE